METVEMNSLEQSLLTVTRIAEGLNPITGTPATEDMILNNPEIIRNMFMAKEILEAVKRNDGIIGKVSKKNSQDLPYVTQADLNEFYYQGDKTITKLVEQINSLFDLSKFRKIGYALITNSLKLNGYLEEQRDEAGKIISVASEKGNSIGIYSEMRTSMYGRPYMSVVYGKNAQEFIVSHLENIIDGEVF